MRLSALALMMLVACERVGPPPRAMQILVVPLTLEASYAIRTECAPSDNPNVALDYGASGTAASYTATAYKYLRYYACPEPTLDRLAARP